VSRSKGISVLAPYFSQYFFVTLPFEAARPLPSWPACVVTEWRDAVASIREKRALSPTGRGFLELTR